MKEYANRIQSLQNPTFQQIRKISNDALSHFSKSERDTFWQNLNQGVDLLDSHELMCQYIFSYGNMHEAKIQKALSSISNPKEVFKTDIAIIDWGCGQGLATVCFFDFLKSQGIPNNTQKVILIEPSEQALERAKLHTNVYIKDETKIQLVNKYLDEVERTDIETNQSITIHFFSNILDVPQIDLKKLAQLVGENVIGEHYFFCVSPLIEGRSHRLDAFYNYFDLPPVLSDFEQSENKLNLLAEEAHGKDVFRKYTLKLKVFKFEKGKTYYIPIDYYPAVQFHAGYYLDCFKDKRANLSLLSDFEVSAPFDIGASAYQDINPILAVLNNIITRGLPTKASPFIETQFQSFGNNFQRTDFGSIIFENKNVDPNNLQLTQSPVAIARLQKTIIEAILTEKLDIQQSQWNILVKENDVPCAAMAFEDLKQIFENLTALSLDFETMKFPQVNLEIIGSQEYLTSPLHLNTKPVASATSQQKSKVYDLVIDISMAIIEEIKEQTFSEFKCKNHCYFNIRSAKIRRNQRHIYTSDTIQYKPLVTSDTQGNYEDIETNKLHLKYFVQLLFRKEDFRQGQLPILNRALQNKSVIGLLPTGGGKTLTYQLAAMLQPGVTLIIDPLRSLMKDQYDGLVNIGIDTCTFINSTLTAQEKDERERQMGSSQMQFVFLSPERLCIYKFRERLKTMRDMNVYFAYGVIDEVHCVSEWGHDFRFSYLHLGRNLYNYVLPKNKDKRLTLFGLTATASFDVLADVERELSGNGAFALDSDTIVRYENTNRLELQYKIEKVPIEYEADKFFDKNGLLDSSLGKAVNITDKWTVYNSKKEFLKKYISLVPSYANELQTEISLKRVKTQFNNRQNTKENNDGINLKVDFPIDFYTSSNEYQQAGIVFCPHKKNGGISVNENAISLKDYTPNIGTFMGSGDDEDSDEIDRASFENLELFRDNKLPIMVATKAFGMGIDKPNVRFTVNMNYSSSLESFIQEAGRAGRDKKIALATILFADYKLVRINSKFPSNQFPLRIIKNKWFKEEDLNKIIKHYNLIIGNEFLDYFTPHHDLVKLRCEDDNKKFTFGECDSCELVNNCSLSKTPKEAKGFQYIKDLEEILKINGLDFSKKNLEYISADYETVMFFYNNSFNGSLNEKKTMHAILSKSATKYFLDDNEEIKVNEIETVNNFLEKLLSVEVGVEIVAFISYRDNYADYSKAIYRMCCIELIDDFTQDYSKQQFRIVTKRKADGEYYKGLKRFLTRYYSIERAEEEIKKVPAYKGDNEIHKCLSYLTEFIYEKIAVKRKRAIDDMRTFCVQGINDKKDWKEVNEDLKDFIYYYFNSKYAQDNYETENGEAFSLTTDTDKGKLSSFDILFKYLRVINEDVYGSSGSPKDSVKHLQGAVRLIRRSLTDNNPALAMLNAFSIAYLGTNNNEVLEQELENSYKEGYRDFYSNNTNKDEFYIGIEKLASNLKISHIPKKTIKKMHDWTTECELHIHTNWLTSFTEKYTNAQ
ncbi:superfamily II DNA helicase RecQ [Runella defluvii]|uniref:DNA 3'-5' helicase n=1 Tax=Runella defluvii TaxID=370973 RepID=A0A7W5ZML6_9BACT|nr:DEAD/DEAH box helicase [Runella defluvii]MBB3840123.1 superfamily II DNA helicase RecQ [Runella defluvii]